MFINLIVRPYLMWKESHSRWLNNRWINYREPLPNFTSHDQIMNWLNHNFKYRADAFYGAYDTYTHPETAWYCAKNKAWGTITFDCDDYATMVWKLMQKMPKYKPTIYNLIINERKPWDFNYNHVVCYFETPSGGRKVIDTHPYIHNLIRDDSKKPAEQIRERFSQLYGKDYKYCIPVRYPFY